MPWHRTISTVRSSDRRSPIKSGAGNSLCSARHRIAKTPSATRASWPQPHSLSHPNPPNQNPNQNPNPNSNSRNSKPVRIPATRASTHRSVEAESRGSSQVVREAAHAPRVDDRYSQQPRSRLVLFSFLTSISSNLSLCFATASTLT